MFTARITEGNIRGIAFSGRQAVRTMKKAATNARKGRGAFRLELSENDCLSLVAFGSTAVEATETAADMHRKAVRGGGR